MGHDRRQVRPNTGDQRNEPRGAGPLHFRYHLPARGDRDVQGWLAGRPATGPEHLPDLLMNFSPAGIAFDDLPRCVDGDALCFELGIPDDPRRWRGAATVLRVSPVPIDERDEGVAATHRIAVSVTSLPGEAIEALRNYTVRTRQASGRDR
jgi:hypothetical protein